MFVGKIRQCHHVLKLPGKVNLVNNYTEINKIDSLFPTKQLWFFKLCFQRSVSTDKRICSRQQSTMATANNRNRLASERSPYLLQHAANPVQWYPWGDEAFQKARSEDKPIFLSVGYSTCHWCHVMEKESFENESIAEVMNEHFVNVKVDREERPDVDQVYMTFVQVSSGGGGWPMSVFLTPDLKPIACGTYFPPEDKWGRPGFRTVLLTVAKQWKDDKVKMVDRGSKIVDILQKTTVFDVSLPASLTTGAVPGEESWKLCFRQLSDSYESLYGGFGLAPKFPQPANLLFLLHLLCCPVSDITTEAQSMLKHTLKMMHRGGIHDHISQGFARYSTDEKWHVPHFEKMLYDQGQLAVVYAKAYQMWKDPLYEETIRDIITYVSRDLSHPEGGFYSAEDADSFAHEGAKEKREGAFCVWTYDEVQELLSAPVEGKPELILADIFNYYYHVKDGGNVEPGQDPHGELTDQNVLIVKHSEEEAAGKFGLSVDELRKQLAMARSTLYEARQKRPRPHLDDKIITAWNGLMISGYAHAGNALGDESYIKRGLEAAKFIRKHLYDEQSGKLLRSCYTDGSGKSVVQISSPIYGFLDDYAFLVRGLIDLYEASYDPAWLEWALQLQETQDSIFWDDSGAGYFATTSSDDILLRLKDDQDGAEPSGNSVSVQNLLRLAAIFDSTEMEEKAGRVLATFTGRLSRSPVALPEMASALITYHNSTTQIVITGNADDPDTRSLLSAVHSKLIGSRVVLLADGNEESILYKKSEMVSRVKPTEGKATAYVCRRGTCSLPVHTPDQLVQLIQPNQSAWRAELKTSGEFEKRTTGLKESKNDVWPDSSSVCNKKLFKIDKVTTTCFPTKIKKKLVTSKLIVFPPNKVSTTVSSTTVKKKFMAGELNVTPSNKVSTRVSSPKIKKKLVASELNVTPPTKVPTTTVSSTKVKKKFVAGKLNATPSNKVSTKVSSTKVMKKLLASKLNVTPPNSVSTTVSSTKVSKKMFGSGLNTTSLSNVSTKVSPTKVVKKSVANELYITPPHKVSTTTVCDESCSQGGMLYKDIELYTNRFGLFADEIKPSKFGVVPGLGIIDNATKDSSCISKSIRNALSKLFSKHESRSKSRRRNCRSFRKHKRQSRNPFINLRKRDLEAAPKDLKELGGDSFLVYLQGPDNFQNYLLPRVGKRAFFLPWNNYSSMNLPPWFDPLRRNNVYTTTVQTYLNLTRKQTSQISPFELTKTCLQELYNYTRGYGSSTMFYFTTTFPLYTSTTSTEMPPNNSNELINRTLCETVYKKRCICLFKKMVSDIDKIIEKNQDSDDSTDDILAYSCGTYVPVPDVYNLTMETKSFTNSMKRIVDPFVSIPQEGFGFADNDFEELKVLKRDTELPTTGSAMFVFPHSNIEIPCFTNEEYLLFSEFDGAASYSWQHTNTKALSERRILEDPNQHGSLQIQDVSVQDAGEYNCCVRYVDPDSYNVVTDNFTHTVIVVELPEVSVRAKLHYLTDDESGCSADNLAALMWMLPVQLENTICEVGDNQGTMCSIYAHNPLCHKRLKTMMTNESEVARATVNSRDRRSHVVSLVMVAFVPDVRKVVRSARDAASCSPACGQQLAMKVARSMRDSLSEAALSPVLKKDTKYNPDQHSLAVKVTLSCPGGFQLRRGFCEPCPQHHFKRESGPGKCLHCSKGYNQDLVGSKGCVPCAHPWSPGCSEMMVVWPFVAAIMSFTFITIASLCCCCYCFCNRNRSSIDSRDVEGRQNSSWKKLGGRCFSFGYADSATTTKRVAQRDGGGRGGHHQTVVNSNYGTERISDSEAEEPLLMHGQRKLGNPRPPPLDF